MKPTTIWRGAILAIAILVHPSLPDAQADGGIGFPAAQSVGVPPGQPVELNWAQKMFSALKHDFGGVAKGADVRCQFTIRNIYKERVEIRAPRSSCGCANPQLIDPKRPDVLTNAVALETNEAAALVVKIDTIGHSQAKSPTISVDVTFFAEGGAYSKVVDIPITVYIRPDIVMTPPAAEFGNLDAGVGGERHVNIAYAGNEAWQIREVRSNSRFVQAEVKQLNRGGGRVDYDLVIRVARDAPEGDIREQLVLVTNDANSPSVPYIVRAAVTPEFQVLPAMVNFGSLKPGVKKNVSVVIKGKVPFQIEGVECESERTCFAAGISREPKVAHVVQITVDPPNEPGPLKEVFVAKIAGKTNVVRFQGEGKIEAVAPTSGEQSGESAGPAVGPPS